MKNIDYDDILSQLSRRRQDNLRIQDRRKAELYEKLPRVKEIDDELVHMAVQEARARIMRHDPDTAPGSKGNTDSSSNASSSKALNQTLKETLREERRSLFKMFLTKRILTHLILAYTGMNHLAATVIRHTRMPAIYWQR